MPVAAVTEGGMLTVRSGSRMAARQAAFLSPQAIFMCVLASAISAYDWASLPVPAVVGTAIIGKNGSFALPRPR